MTATARTDLLDQPRIMSPDKQTLDELRIDRRTAPKRRSKPWLAVIGMTAIAVVAGMVWWLNRPKAAVVRTILVQ